MFWRVQRLLTGLSRRSWFFGRSGHRVGVLCLHKTTPSAGAVHVAGLCDRDWVQRNTLGNATQAIKQKITRQTWGMYEKKNISHFLLDRLDFNLNYVFVYKVFCKIIPMLNTQLKTSGKTPESNRKKMSTLIQRLEILIKTSFKFHIIKKRSAVHATQFK